MNYLIISALILFLLEQTRGADSTPLLIIKTDHSGSSWFHSLLNRLGGVYICEEIIPPDKRVSAKKRKQIEHASGGMTAYIVESLQHPMLRYPKGKDLTQRNKTILIVGSTYSPWKSFANPEEIGRLVPNLRVVAYVRTNIVKHAISFLRARELAKKCSHMVVISDKKCTIGSKTTVVFEKFENALILMIAWEQYLWKTVNLLNVHLKHKFRVVTYEDLLGLENEVERLLWWLGFDISDLEFEQEFNGRCNLNCTKNTSDDLRNSIANYEEVESWINSLYPCLISQFHETRPGKVQPFIRNVCGDLFRSRVYSLLRRERKKHTKI